MKRYKFSIEIDVDDDIIESGFSVKNQDWIETVEMQVEQSVPFAYPGQFVAKMMDVRRVKDIK